MKHKNTAKKKKKQYIKRNNIMLTKTKKIATQKSHIPQFRVLYLTP